MRRPFVGQLFMIMIFTCSIINKKNIFQSLIAPEFSISNSVGYFIEGFLACFLA
jgi:hypothetical protein